MGSVVQPGPTVPVETGDDTRCSGRSIDIPADLTVHPWQAWNTATVPVPDRSLFADRLRTELRGLRLSQAALAEQLGVSQQTVSKWLTGETQPRVKLLPALAEALGMEPTDLSAALVARAEPKTLDEAMELRVAALDRRIRDLTPAQMDRLEAYVRGLRDGAGSS